MESCYNENNVYRIESMRAVHFEKLLPNKDARQGSGEKRVYRKFCSFGYYNQMSYARAEKSSIMNYKHTFLVKYPYERSQNWIMADQMFMLLNEKQSVSSPDPFECENPQNAPFIGIILVTVSKCFEFKEDKVKKQFEKISQRESGIYRYMVSQYKTVCEELGSRTGELVA